MCPPDIGLIQGVHGISQQSPDHEASFGDEQTVAAQELGIREVAIRAQSRVVMGIDTDHGHRGLPPNYIELIKGSALDQTSVSLAALRAARCDRCTDSGCGHTESMFVPQVPVTSCRRVGTNGGPSLDAPFTSA